MKETDTNKLFGICSDKSTELPPDNKKTNRSSKVLVIGGTGTGKTFKYIKPSTLSDDSRIIIVDPDERTYANLMGIPYNELTISRKEKAAFDDRWSIIYADVAEILREINPALSESESLVLAKDFFSESYPYDYLYYRCSPNGQNSVESYDFRDSYGEEPFFFTEDNHVKAVNKPVFKEWVEDLIEIKRYCLKIRE